MKTQAFPSTQRVEKGVMQWNLSIEVGKSSFPYRHRSLFEGLSKSSENSRAGSTAKSWKVLRISFNQFDTQDVIRGEITELF
jgi:hypothetical protein